MKTCTGMYLKLFDKMHYKYFDLSGDIIFKKSDSDIINLIRRKFTWILVIWNIIINILKNVVSKPGLYAPFLKEKNAQRHFLLGEGHPTRKL